ncbi:ABC transporter substrate-binding protein [Falsirhodobacter algicola]|uniref:Diguanylate cyclase n=1 Tax=Falsirhodobacter algicola TaxID=2692330 RepID=A0A8J8MSG3_9RHOB|nr:ABC transporter substrate-binding protein [Falsirhodobacter algicola]QUS35453.1 diguanylate cyclase [Falsirhodobacter algicola]
MTHPAARHHAADHLAGRINRREFLSHATALGVSVPVAYGLIGLRSPARAAGPAPGGTLRMAMSALPLCDPRIADWPEIGNVLRGWLEPLVQYNPDGTFTGALLESWAYADDARTLTLHLRPGIRWSNGDPFTAADVAANLRRWADAGVPGNAMAAVTAALQTDGRLNEDAVAIADDLTLTLTLGFPDATLIASFAEYTALLVHPAYDGADPSVDPVGTGPFLPVQIEPGTRHVLELDVARPWWGTEVLGGPWLDRIEYVDLGTDPARAAVAARAGEIEAVDQTIGRATSELDDLGWERSECPSAATLAIRFNQRMPPYDDRRVRLAIQKIVSNAVVLEIGYAGQGEIGENHHVAPLQPDYSPIGPAEFDTEAGLALLREAGMEGEEFTLTSLDDEWQALSCDVVAAQMVDAGLTVTRQILPGRDYWPNWRGFAFSATNWNMRPLGVQVLRLAYQSGSVWNETGFADPAFDEALRDALAIVDAEERQSVMQRLETMLRDQGVLIQPFWRRLARHVHPRAHGMDITPVLDHRHHEWWLEPAPAP